LSKAHLHKMAASICTLGCASLPLPRLRGRAREGAHATSQRRGRGPLPNPPPQAEEGKESAASFYLRLLKFVAAVLILLIACDAGAEAGLTQAALDEISVQPEPDAALPLELQFFDESAQPRILNNVLAGKPAILVFTDYTCHTLCGPVLSFVAAGLERSGLAAGPDYRLVVIGLDSKDDPESAGAMKAARVGSGTPLAAATTMLTGEQMAINAATAALGYRFAYDSEHDQFAHPAAAFVVNSAGRVTRVLSGLGLDGADLRLALVEAGEGHVGSLGDRLRLLCYGFDPVRGIYTEKITLWLELAAIFTLLSMAAAMVAMNAKSRRSTAS
jgi:protein SCO1